MAKKTATKKAKVKAKKPAVKKSASKKPAAKKPAAKKAISKKAKPKKVALKKVISKKVAVKPHKNGKPLHKNGHKHIAVKHVAIKHVPVKHVESRHAPKKQLTKINGDNRSRFSDPELNEFKKLIVEKLEAARSELKFLQDQINRKDDNGTDDTENKFASPDDGTSTLEREYLSQMAARQALYIDHLDKALLRIQNKTYGICRVTGKLIEKERLRAVPHATLSMEAKLLQAKS
jgi:RNA polymerase-binding transcription factor DksA